MKDIYILFENEKLIAVFDNFIKFRKNSFHYILSILVKNGKFKNKLEGGRKLKKEFSDFYGKNSVDFRYSNYQWKIINMKINDLTEELIFKDKKEEKENNDYVSEFTKINVIRGTKMYKSLNENLAYVKLTPLYGQ